MASIISAGTTAGTALNMTGDTTGNLAFQTAAGANTITVPNGTGTIAVQGVSTNIVSGTAVSASGTSIDFTGIPSWVKRVTLMLQGVTTNGTSIYQVQLGAGSIQTTGYSAQYTYNGGSNNGFSISTGFGIYNDTAGQTINGQIIFSLLNAATGLWVASGSVGASNNYIRPSAGSKTLSGTLDRIRLTTVNGTDSYNAGSINILYE